jgi:type IV secretion system protein VirD4
MPKECHTLPYVCDQFLGIDPQLGVADPKRFEEFLIDMLTNNVAGGIAQLAASKVMAMGENEKGSVLSTFARSVKWITDPAMRRHLSGTNFPLNELACGDPESPVTVYVVLPLTMMREQARWMRTTINMTLGLIQNAPAPPPVPVVCLLDEFAQLGPGLRKIQEGIVTLRSANVKLWPIVQSISQLKAGFGSQWETFISSSTGQFLGVRDLATAQLANQLCGKDLYQRHDQKLWRARVAQEQPRELITPEEIMEELGKDRPMQFVFPTNGLPMRLQRIAYKPLTINGHRFEGLPLEGHFEE